VNVRVSVCCPSCGADPEVGPAEAFGGVITRRALACGCGWIGKLTTTLVRQSARDLDHVA
jgi:hypothetical protein